MSVTKSELAEALGVSTRTIERWAAAGMPVLEQRAAQGRPRYNLAQCRKWAAERPTQGRHKPARAKGAPELGLRALEDPEKVELTPAERLTKARATNLEIKLHQRRGNILTKSEVETEWTRQGRAVRAAMLEVPAAVAIRYPGVEGLEDTCRHLIIDAMKHLAAGYKARQGVKELQVAPDPRRVGGSGGPGPPRIPKGPAQKLPALKILVGGKIMTRIATGMTLLLLLAAAGCGGDDNDGGSVNPFSPTGVTSSAPMDTTNAQSGGGLSGISR